MTLWHRLGYKDGASLCFEGKPSMRFAVHYLRASKSFIVRRDDGITVATGIEAIEEAWLLAAALHQEQDDRIAARRASLEAARAVKAARLKSAAGAAATAAHRGKRLKLFLIGSTAGASPGPRSSASGAPCDSRG